MRVVIIQQPEKPFPKRILGFRVSFVVFGVVIIQQERVSRGVAILLLYSYNNETHIKTLCKLHKRKPKTL